MIGRVGEGASAVPSRIGFGCGADSAVACGRHPSVMLRAERPGIDARGITGHTSPMKICYKAFASRMSTATSSAARCAMRRFSIASPSRL